MKSKPILFSAAMVRALLDGTKSQTRRKCIARTQDQSDIIGGAIMEDIMDADIGYHEGEAWRRFPCPYGQAGDQLWVREEHYQFGHWEPIKGKLTKGGRQKWAFITHPDSAVTFTPPAVYRKGRHHKDSATPAWHKRLARFMPRSYSRITLEVVSVRVERLQEISEQDAIAEGVRCRCMSSAITVTPRVAYSELWESINGPGSWDANPWVWVVEFRRVEA